MAIEEPGKGRWYAARLLFRSWISDVPQIDPLCEERVVLFRANDEHTARLAAGSYGLKEQCRYRNQANELVEWRFSGIEDIEELDGGPEPGGWEVASRHFRPSDVRRAKETEDRLSG